MCAEEDLGAAPHLFCLIYAWIHMWSQSCSLGRAFRIIVLTQPSESVVRAEPSFRAAAPAALGLASGVHASQTQPWRTTDPASHHRSDQVVCATSQWLAPRSEICPWGSDHQQSLRRSGGACGTQPAEAATSAHDLQTSFPADQGEASPTMIACITLCYNDHARCVNQVITIDLPFA